MFKIPQQSGQSYINSLFTYQPRIKMSKLKFEKFFRNPIDLKHIDAITQRLINLHKPINLAVIGLGESAIEPISILTQIQLTARRNGKNLGTIMGKVDFVDLDTANNIKHSPEILKTLTQTGQNRFISLNNGLAPKEQEYIYKHFKHYLDTSQKRYLGHPLEDFVDDPRNHNLYDMTFCNNVFYYVGFGKNKIGTKYTYITPRDGIFYTNETNCRYREVLDNLLSTVNKEGKVFFHHNGKSSTGSKSTLSTEMRNFVNEQKKNFKEVDIDIYERVS